MSMMGLPEVAVGAIFAAVIAGAVSLLGLIISKEQKTSEFRQDWIDGLRAEIAALIAHANAIHAATALNPSDWKSRRDDYVGINIAAAQIRLRLNPDETLSQRILTCMEELESVLNPGGTSKFTELNRIEKALAAHAQQLLKTEWLRVRRGELTFRVAKSLAALIILLLPAALLLKAILPK